MGHLTTDEFFNAIEEHQHLDDVKELMERKVPKILYKYFSFPRQKCEIRKRLTQLQKEQIWFSSKKLLNDPFELEHLSLNGVSADIMDYYKSGKDGLELLCLTDSPFNKLMWSHYADAYRGYCVAFSTESCGNIFPVIYSNRCPDLKNSYENFYNHRKHFKYLGHNSDALSKDLFRILYPTISKDTCWSYESEYRIVRRHLLDGKGGRLYDAKSTKLRITEIIVGALTDKSNIIRLQQLVNKINQNRFLKIKNDILRSSYCTPYIRHNINAYTTYYQKEMPSEYRPVQIRQIGWGNDLTLKKQSVSIR